MAAPRMTYLHRRQTLYTIRADGKTIPHNDLQTIIGGIKHYFMPIVVYDDIYTLAGRLSHNGAKCLFFTFADLKYATNPYGEVAAAAIFGYTTEYIHMEIKRELCRRGVGLIYVSNSHLTSRGIPKIIYMMYLQDEFAYENYELADMLLDEFVQIKN